MLRHITCILLLSPLFLVSTVQAQEVRVVTRIVKDTVPTWKTWKSEEFIINHPGSWGARVPSGTDTAVVFRRHDRPVEISVVGFRGDAPSFEQRVAAGLHQGKVEVLRNDGRTETVPDRVEYAYEEGGIRILAMEEVMHGEGRSYILTYLAPADTFGENLYMAEAMFNSFSPVGR